MRPRIYYSAEQRAEIWDRWKRGESMHEIGRAFDRGHSSIQKILMATGGIRPAVRKRSRLALSLAEREEISRGLVAGFSLRLIADRLSSPRFMGHFEVGFPVLVGACQGPDAAEHDCIA